MSAKFECPKHGSQPCIVLCVHVITGTPPTHYREATEQTTGAAICKTCIHLEIDSSGAMELLSVACSRCFIELTEEHIRRIQRTIHRHMGVLN